MVQPKITLVSGLSGAGKSVALNVLEDHGYYCVDNLPLSLIDTLIDSVKSSYQNIAISIDVRNVPRDTSVLVNLIQKLSTQYSFQMLFVYADSETLIKRYSETRRLHPLSQADQSDPLPLSQSVNEEIRLMLPLRELSHHAFDTSTTTVHEFIQTLRHLLFNSNMPKMSLIFKSFGFKHGLPRDADLVFDARFLPNPHWEPSLRSLTGLDKTVQDYFLSFPDMSDFEERIRDNLYAWLPKIQNSNRSYFTVAIGCTGGQHRSVYVAQRLSDYFKAHHSQYRVHIEHETLMKHTYL